MTHSGSWGTKPLRWVRQTDGNEEAVRYLADRLAKLGWKRLAELGAVEGSTVIIGPEDNAVVFDWVPSWSMRHRSNLPTGRAQEPESAEPITGEESTRQS